MGNEGRGAHSQAEPPPLSKTSPCGDKPIVEHLRPCSWLGHARASRSRINYSKTGGSGAECDGGEIEGWGKGRGAETLKSRRRDVQLKIGGRQARPELGDTAVIDSQRHWEAVVVLPPGRGREKSQSRSTCSEVCVSVCVCVHQQQEQEQEKERPRQDGLATRIGSSVWHLSLLPRQHCCSTGE